jgi:hypothetical protein
MRTTETVEFGQTEDHSVVNERNNLKIGCGSIVWKLTLKGLIRQRKPGVRNANQVKAHPGKKIENLLPYAPQIEGPKGQVTGGRKVSG